MFAFWLIFGHTFAYTLGGNKLILHYMKKLANIFLVVSFSMAGCYSVSQTPRGNDYYNSNEYQSTGLSYQTFYDQLQPYGNWIDYPGYGYVWQPNAGSDFMPYQTNGNWVSTVDG